MVHDTFIKSTGGYNPYGGIQSPAPKRPNQLICSCGCPYLEQKIVARWNAEKNTVIGSPVMPVSDGVYYIYVCIACGSPVEQPLHFMGIDPGRQEHEEIINIMTNKDKSVPEE